MTNNIDWKPITELPKEDCEALINVVHYYRDIDKNIKETSQRTIVDFNVKEKGFFHKTCIASFTEQSGFEMIGVTECGFEAMKLPKPKLTHYAIITPPITEDKEDDS